MEHRDFLSTTLIALFLVPIPILFSKFARLRRGWPGIPCVYVPRVNLKRLIFSLVTICLIAVVWLGFLFVGGNYLEISIVVLLILALLSGIDGFLLYHLHSMKETAEGANIWICRAEAYCLEILAGQQIHIINLKPGCVAVIKTLHGPGGIVAFDYLIQAEGAKFCIALPWSYYWNLDIQYTDTARYSEGLLVKTDTRKLIQLHRNLQAFVVT